jgi:BirA family biotin operon repressor/biotin-[acetyl-CoA-carboxylase] ligase
LSNTPKLGNTVLAYTETTSTNDLVKQLIQQHILPDGCVVTARYQTAGKGQQGRIWQSDIGMNLLCSFVIPQQMLALDKQVYVNMAVSMAVWKTVNSFCNSAAVKIKWPNDIYVGDKKVAGILIENILQGDNWKYCIAGIGINVRQRAFEQINATSILLESEEDCSIEEVLKKLIEHMNYYLQITINSDCADLHLRYLDNLYKKGERIMLVADEFEDARPATLVGVDQHGKILVNENGTEQSYSHAQVRIAQTMDSTNRT